MVIEKKNKMIMAPAAPQTNRKLVAYSVCCLAVILVALAGQPLGLPQVALESTQWALVAALGLFSGANVGEHFAGAKKILLQPPKEESTDAQDK